MASTVAVDRNIRLLSLGVAVRMLGNALYGPFVALYVHNVLGVGYVELGLIVVFIGGIQIPFSVVGGLVADRVRRKTLMIVGLTSEAVATAALAYAFSVQSLGLVIATAVVGGTIGSIAGPAFSAYIADFAVGSQRTRGFTLFRIGFNAGFAAGVALGGLFIEFIGFAGGVAVAAGIIGAATVALQLLLGPSPRDQALPGAPRASTVRGDTPAVRSRTLGESLRLLAKDRVALEVAVAFSLSAFVAGQWSTILPLYVHNVLGISYALLGVGLSINGLVVVFGQSPTTESVIGRKHTSIAVLGLLFYTAAFIGLGAAGLWDLLPVVAFFIAVFVLTVGENLIAIPQTTLPSNLAPKEEIGSYNGVVNAFQVVGGITATLAGGVVLAYVANPLLIWVVLLTPVLPALLLLRHAGRRIPEFQNRA